MPSGFQTFRSDGSVKLDTSSVLPRMRYQFIAPYVLGGYRHSVTIPGLGALLAAQRAAVICVDRYMNPDGSDSLVISGDTISVHMATTGTGPYNTRSILNVWYWG